MNTRRRFGRAVGTGIIFLGAATLVGFLDRLAWPFELATVFRLQYAALLLILVLLVVETGRVTVERPPAGRGRLGRAAAGDGGAYAPTSSGQAAPRVEAGVMRAPEGQARGDGRSSREPVRYLVFSASLRADSLNTRLAHLAAETIGVFGGEVDLTSMREFDVPSYDADVQSDDGFPPGAETFRLSVERCDAFVVSSPEYNSSIPGLLKNAIDWVSRYRPQPFNERHGLLLSASPSMVGGNRGLWALRVPFEHLGARLYPDMFSLAQAHNAFTPDGRIANEQLHERFETNIANFMDLVEAAKHYPCVKRAWVEYLGEHPDPVIDRVE